MKAHRQLIAMVLLAAPALALAQATVEPPVLAVAALAKAPRVDGDLAEWGSTGWLALAVTPALQRTDRPRHGLEEADDRNVTGSLTLLIKAGVADGRLFVALRWPDASADADPPVWEWRDGAYKAARRWDDQLSLRFHLAGDFNRSMLSASEYRVDVWLWSAGRSNPGGVAEDLSHAFSTRATENAAEYALPGGATVYMRKPRDAGLPPWRPLPPPRQHQGERAPAIELQKPTGSAADVAARGQWKAGFWQLEFARALNTGHPDDAVFKPGTRLLGQVAVFNRGRDEHKSVTEPLLFDFSALR